MVLRQALIRQAWEQHWRSLGAGCGEDHRPQFGAAFWAWWMMATDVGTLLALRAAGGEMAR
ncbi:MAG: hypothetical protein ACKV22_08110 [Bryobacteraceae bacterium]